MSKRAVVDRFMSHVKKTDTCWLWVGGVNEGGYGMFKYNSRAARSHRVSWELHCGVVPAHLFVLHKCDVRTCVNPDHLFLGTKRDNNLDMVLKGRQVWGVRNGRHKLSEEDVVSIRDFRRQGATLRSIASRFRVSSGHICDIIGGRRWVHLS